MSPECSKRLFQRIVVLALTQSFPTSSKNIDKLKQRRLLCNGQPPWLAKPEERKTVGCWFDAPSQAEFPYICQKDLLDLNSSGHALELRRSDDELCGGDGWIVGDRLCYKLFKKRLSFANAERSCSKNAEGGHLAMISSNESNWLVARLCSEDLLDGCLIGVQKVINSEKHGVWVWANGTELSYTSWFIDQPQARGWAEGDEVAIIGWHNWQSLKVGQVQKLLQGAVGFLLFVVTIISAVVLCFVSLVTSSSRRAQPDVQHRRLEADTSLVTGLRAISATMIATGHCFAFCITMQMEFNGGFAVTLFMFISGVVLVVAFVDKCNDIDFDYNFLVRRLVRLFPVHWLALALSYPVLFTHLPAIPDLVAGVVLSVPATFVLVQSWWMPVLLLGGNGVAWTMSTFLYFYIAFPHLLRALDHQYREGIPSNCMMVCISIISVALPFLFFCIAKALGWDDFTAYMACRAHPFARLPVFYLGMLTGLKVLGPPQKVVEHELQEVGSLGSVNSFMEDSDSSREQLLKDVRSVAKPKRRYMGDLLSLLMVVLCTATTLCEKFSPPERRLAFRSFLEFGCTPLLPFWLHSLLHVRAGCARASLSHRFVTTMGNWSFSMYLLQLPTWDLTKIIILGSVDKRFPAYMAPVLLIEVLLLAALCYTFVEEPCRRRLAKCLQREESAAQPLELAPLTPNAQAETARAAYIFTCTSCGCQNQVSLVPGAPLPVCMCYQCGSTSRPNDIERQESNERSASSSSSSSSSSQMAPAPQAELIRAAFIFTCVACGCMNQVSLVLGAPLPPCMCYQCGSSAPPDSLSPVG